jgi:hypothetical protein
VLVTPCSWCNLQATVTPSCACMLSFSSITYMMRLSCAVLLMGGAKHSWLGDPGFSVLVVQKHMQQVIAGCLA